MASDGAERMKIDTQAFLVPEAVSALLEGLSAAGLVDLTGVKNYGHADDKAAYLLRLVRPYLAGAILRDAQLLDQDALVKIGA